MIAVASAQNVNTLPVKMIRLHSTTAIGKPDGEAETNPIGEEGGNIASVDGKVKLIFPESALPKKKKITIQPVTIQAANG